jgi:N-acetylmuramic acid 6-phosphate etherase
MATEEVDPRFADLDGWSLSSAMDAMWEGQLAAVAAIGHALPSITAATEAAQSALGDRGRIVYVGAGTSGRVAVQDGAELMPTFAWPSERVHFIVAGGDSAFVTSIEGAEDDIDDAVKQVNAARLAPHDVVIAVAASGTTPFTVAALQQAGSCGAVTIGVANNPGTALLESVRFPILVETGPEEARRGHGSPDRAVRSRPGGTLARASGGRYQNGSPSGVGARQRRCRDHSEKL